MGTHEMTDAARWQSVLAKDKSADGKFFFSVRTTGVYCRPSCPARPARRENVAFHPSCDAAEAAGFRADCTPEAARPDPAPSQRLILEHKPPPND